ncbi:MAG: riboflavin biosynthesis protein RibF [Actinobacteria bacterium]|uniref:Bifunctional riboflavin kinase/FMN adenylyltransferase n=1 Tax=freshwater metagenome TaxID=449393 RepID=A0A6J6QGH7_9ZZZZ|nr:riboflavin biosynthesis protein RibF [Actinomycetota bacterium]
MKVAYSPAELEPVDRTVAIGVFDGVHLGHRAVIARAVEGRHPTVLTFDPHPRAFFGHRVPILSSLERRLELLADIGVEETLVVTFDGAVAALSPDEFADNYLGAIGARTVIAGADFRFGNRRTGDLETLRERGFEVATVPLVDGISSSHIRELVAAGDVRSAAPLLGRPFEVEGVVVSGDARGGTLGFPTANLRSAPDAAIPLHGIYAGSARGTRSAISIGINPHYGGKELRLEAFLLDFEGDLYGERLVVELWDRLRDEAVFESEAALIDQIAADVAATRAATPPV